MSEQSSASFNRGKMFHNTGTSVASADFNAEAEGRMVELRNTDPTTPTTLRSPIPLVSIQTRWMGTFGNGLPRRLAKWASGYRGKRVDGYACVTGAEVAGVIDDALPAAGVPYGDLFHLIIKGRVECLTSLAQDADAAEGAQLIALTGATSGATTSGRVGVFTADNTAQTDAFVPNVFGRCVTARLSNVTNTYMAVDLSVNTY